MAGNLSAAWRSFWHTMTSNDRHASHDSPYRTGQHMPISQNRHAPLTSVATSAVDSQVDLASAYNDDFSKQPTTSSTAFSDTPGGKQSPTRPPYSPGMRSQSMTSPKRAHVEERAAPGEIQMQSFSDGAPPPPPVSHSWKKIEKWTERHYEELGDQLGEGCTQNDINELEHELDMSLPQDVRDSLAIHDGQERGGRPTGIIFGCMLLDCEEIVQEWKNWKTVNEEYLSGHKKPLPHYPIKGLNGQASSSSSHSHNGPNKYWREDLLDRQESQPPKAIQKAYAHPSWIPLARDWGGNNIAIDLAPGPMGKWGQIILFGRDYDCKYVVSRSWAHFLATVADDLCSEKTFVEEESGELKLREFKSQSVEPAYMDILRWRADQKYGRRGPKRKSQTPLGLNTNVNAVSTSPYGSPVIGNDERGRPQQRFPRQGSSSPRHPVGTALARVQEEHAQPSPVRIGGDVVKDFADNAAPPPIGTKQARNSTKLVDVPTPIEGKGEKKEFPVTSLSKLDEDTENKENKEQHPTTGLGFAGIEQDMQDVTI